MIKAVRAALVLGLALLAAAPAVAQERTDFGPFYVLASEPDRIYLVGTLRDGSAQALFDHLLDAPGARELVLNSSGGLVVEALTIAELVHASAIDTVVPAGASCSGPCFFIFMAGAGRTAAGQLVLEAHPDETTALQIPDSQLSATEHDALIRYGAPAALADVLEGLQPLGQHVLTPAEIQSYHLAKPPTDGASPPALAVVPPSLPPIETFRPTDGATGLLSLTNIDGEVVLRSLAATAWYQSSDLGTPSVQMRILSEDPALGARVTFQPAAGENERHFRDVIVVDFVTRTADARSLQIDSVGAIGGLETTDSAAGAAGLSFLLRDAGSTTAGEYTTHRFLLFIPTIFSTFVRDVYAHYDLFSLYFTLEGGREGLFTFTTSPGGRSAFDEALAAWAD